MNTKELASEYRLAQWAQQMKERTASGMSVKEFCQERGISRNTYFYWQRRLREAAARQLAAAAQAENEQQALPPGGWVQAVEEAPELVEAALPIEIGGCRIMVGNNTDPELLAKVCKVLVSLC
jgi:putative transposase